VGTEWVKEMDGWGIRSWYKLFWGVRSVVVRIFLLFFLLMNRTNMQPIISPLEPTIIYKTYGTY
jgi:hypothetical protein